MAIAARGLPAPEHGLAVLRRVAVERDARPDPRRPPPQGPDDGEAVPAPDLGRRGQPVGRRDLWGEERGRDDAKNVDGRKRHIVVDSMGLLLAVLVTAASVDDARAATELFARLDGQPMGMVTRMFADSKYHNLNLYEWVEANARWEMAIIRRPEGKKGWVKLPIRWTVERTFAWLGRCRRLSKDREKTARSSESFIKPAMIQLMLHRLRPSDVDPEFRYRNAA